MEILNPESDQPCAPKERGELVITDFTNIGTPTIRYRTGDLGQLIDHYCPCGRPEPLFTVHGRVANDFVRAAGFELRRDMIEIPLLRLHKIVRNDFEVRVHETYHQTQPIVQISITLALQDGVLDTPTVRQEIIREFNEHWRLAPNLNLHAAITAGLFAPLEINFTTFPHNPKATQKILLT